MKVTANDWPFRLYSSSSTTLADAFFLVFGELGARPTHYETMEDILDDLCRQFTLERKVARVRYVLDDPEWQKQRAATCSFLMRSACAPKPTTSSCASRTLRPSC